MADRQYLLNNARSKIINGFAHGKTQVCVQYVAEAGYQVDLAKAVDFAVQEMKNDQVFHNVSFSVRVSYRRKYGCVARNVGIVTEEGYPCELEYCATLNAVRPQIVVRKIEQPKANQPVQEQPNRSRWQRIVTKFLF